jgi:hypothetical protein
VDFANFSYPWPADLLVRSDHNETFTLKNGELPPTRDEHGYINNMGVKLQSVNYGDVTGDAAEEAMLFMSIQTGGSAQPGIIFIYAWQHNHPVLLWSSPTGDRAEEGLRAMYAQDGQLVLEVNSPDGSQGLCCPTQFTRTRYKWRGGEFQAVKKETLAISDSPKIKKSSSPTAPNRHCKRFYG